ncbi:hypothetical protein BSKO_02127 [Bryopsis sp. KO-2023]|nr:hypothetical protein BSKO_02127 [Bryopsis sp. KO-2023]
MVAVERCSSFRRVMRPTVFARTACRMTLNRTHAPPLHSREHTDRAWEFFTRMGSPKLWVAPMVDASELPFRMLCRRYGATGAYTPMQHARLFYETEKYRVENFTTCPEDRPLLVQFCANDPEILLGAAKIVEPYCDGIDLNLGCPQRIAKRGRYGAYLMDDLPLIENLVKTLVAGVSIPVTCKIRMFEELEPTLEYARMLERAQCSMLGVHARTRDKKDSVTSRADWDVIKAVKEALSIPVLANGNIRDLKDVHACMEYTGADGVMSAVSLLEDPALFSQGRLEEGGEKTYMDECRLFREYLELVTAYPVNLGFVKGHAFRLLGNWLAEFTDIRMELNRDRKLTLEKFYTWLEEIERRIEASGRDYPQPAARNQADVARERQERKLAAIEAQKKEEDAVAELSEIGLSEMSL